MSHTVPTQHPAVVLRSHYRQVCALLAVAMFAVVGLSVAVVLVADDDTGARSATPVSAASERTDAPRYIHSPGQRYYNGTGEGLRGSVPR